MSKVDQLPPPNKPVVLEVIDLNHGKVRLPRGALKPIFSGGDITFKTIAFVNRKNQEVEKCFVNRSNGSFGLGSIHRVQRHLHSKGYKTKIVDEYGVLEPDLYFKEGQEVLGNGIEEFDYQKRILKLAKRHGRGMFVAATGAGKSVAQYLISKNVSGNTLVLCHSIDIVNQLYKGALKFFDEDDVVRMDSSWTGGGRICFCVNKSALLVNREAIHKYFDCVIVDEAHRFSTEYEELFDYLVAPLRFAFTATPPENDRKIPLEKFFGDILLSLDTAWGIKEGILTPPTVVLVKGAFVFGINDGTYQSIYRHAVVQNVMYNRQIAEVIDFNIKNKLTFLCMVTSLEHGENIAKILRSEFKHDIAFLSGKNTKAEREEMQDGIRDRTLPGVIVTNIWEAGIDIANLDSVLMAFNGKVDKGVARVPQFLGRVLRRADGKKSAYIFDFTAKNKYLSEHFVSRLEMYIDQGWNLTSWEVLKKSSI